MLLRRLRRIQRYQHVRRTDSDAHRGRAGLRLAYSPEKGTLFTELVRDFNAQGLKTADGKPLEVAAVEMASEDMIDAACAATSTPSARIRPSGWIRSTGPGWPRTRPSPAGWARPSATRSRPWRSRMWEDVARSMGYPGKRIGWEDIIAKARADSNFGWSHPSTSSASGLLATLAMFYAGRRQDARPDHRGRQGRRHAPVCRRGREDGPPVRRGRMAGHAARHPGGAPSTWTPLWFRSSSSSTTTASPAAIAWWRSIRARARCGKTTRWPSWSQATCRPTDRLTFQAFRDYLVSRPAQERILSHGFRPTDLSIALTGPQSPVSAKNGVNPAEPQTALQIPGPAVVEVVRDVWWYTKRHTNVYLVVDTSGSMEGDKLDAAREALKVFLDQIKGDQERVGIVEFSSSVNNIMPLADAERQSCSALSRNRQDLRAGGDTALLDAIKTAYVRLQKLNDRERINAIVVMTDGRENNSNISLNRLLRDIKTGNSRGVPVVVFCIAFGDDADNGRAASDRPGQQGAGAPGRPGHHPRTVQDPVNVLLR